MSGDPVSLPDLISIISIGMILIGVLTLALYWGDNLRRQKGAAIFIFGCACLLAMSLLVDEGFFVDVRGKVVGLLLAVIFAALVWLRRSFNKSK